MKHTPQSIQNKIENDKTRVFRKEDDNGKTRIYRTERDGKDPMALSAKIYADSEPVVNKESGKLRFLPAFLFLAFIFGLAIWFIFNPKHDYSSSEKRYLQKFPEVTVQSVSSGKFGEEFESYLGRLQRLLRPRHGQQRRGWRLQLLRRLPDKQARTHGEQRREEPLSYRRLQAEPRQDTRHRDARALDGLHRERQAADDT